ncbi:MAG TPA: hypothetical protein ENJ50_03630 [Planctomycetaceae bacterium]|nr:hypothetical protein [Planctomycetaceae bacterium]
MATETAAQVLARYERKAKRVARVRDQSQRAFDRGHIDQALLDHAYESTFLSAVSVFEQFLEDLFVSCLLDGSGIRSVKARVGFPSASVAWEILIAGRGRRYVDWLPFKRTLERADVFLVAGRPFSRLRNRPSDLGAVTEAVTIRNAIAHEGGSATSGLKALGLSHLPSRRRHPAGYLQSKVSGDPALTQHRARLADLNRIARALASKTDKQALRYLGSERQFRSGEAPGRGTYQCVDCHALVALTSKYATLPQCPRCNLGPCLACNRVRQSAYQRS